MATRLCVVLAQRPTGVPTTADFTIVEKEIPQVAEGQLRVRNVGLAVDPATRTLLDEVAGYRAALQIQDTIPGMIIGVVEESRNPNYRLGDVVGAYTGWETHSVIDASNFALERFEVASGVPLTAYLGTLGWSGVTAYIGLHHIGEMRSGDAVVISAAAGSVGNVAGQLAKGHGCRVVGVVGSDEKVAVCQRIGFDTVVNYRREDLATAIRTTCPAGVNVYFDNVGGVVLNTMLPLMADFGRIAVCGMVADYNHGATPTANYNLWQVVVHRLTMRGFLAGDNAAWVLEARRALADHVRSGDLSLLENVSRGLESAPQAFVRLMSGETVGKTVVRLTND